MIAGTFGQYISCMATLFLEKGCALFLIKCLASSFNTSRIDYRDQDPKEQDLRRMPQYGDLGDFSNLIRISQQIQHDKIYDLGVQSHLAVSFEAQDYTANSDALGALRILEAVRMLGLIEKNQDLSCEYQ